jgi:hypothetical protein
MMSIEKRQQYKPQNRSFEEVIEMLLSHLNERPAIMLCKGCRGEHLVSNQRLLIHCVCGVVTQYRKAGLFSTWSSLTWAVMAMQHHGIGSCDTTPLNWTQLSAASIVNEPLTNPQTPLNLRLILWRTRGAL